MPGISLAIGLRATRRSIIRRRRVNNLPGDFNFNGVVDAADYSVWRQ